MSRTGVITLHPDRRAEAQLPGFDAPVQGFWTTQGDTLSLSYGLLDKEVSIDSAAYMVTGGEPEIVFFSKGKEVARQKDSGLQSERKTLSLLVRDRPAGGKLLTVAGKEYVMTADLKLVPASFTLEGVLRGLMGLIALIAILYALSSNRKAIKWKTVGLGLAMQLVIAILMLEVPGVKGVFEWVAGGFVSILGFAKAGSSFLFSGLSSDVNQFGYIFAFQVLPTIVFFSGVTSLLYYLGILQRVVFGFAWVMTRTLGLSGAEGLSAAGNIFLGQTESPLLIRPYFPKMTRSEILCVMVGGMATIAGGVFAAYVGYLGGDDPVQQQMFATHLLTASVMSAPAAIVCAKMLVPETEQIESRVEVPKDRIGTNILDAISIGTTDGLKLAVNVGVMLLVFTAMIDMVNYIVEGLIGKGLGLNAWVSNFTDGRYLSFNLQFIFGMVFAPLAWLMGVPTQDVLMVGQLLGEKTILNEFFAYTTMGTMKETGVMINEKSLIIATYALCGFSNFASIGIQIGGIGALAPEKRSTLASLGIKALIGGTAACMLTAVIAGALVGL